MTTTDTTRFQRLPRAILVVALGIADVAWGVLR